MLILVTIFNNMYDNSFSRMALVVILVRAGLDLDPPTLHRLKFTVIKLSVIPWTVEALSVAVLSHFFLEIPWMYAILLGMKIILLN